MIQSLQVLAVRGSACRIFLSRLPITNPEQHRTNRLNDYSSKFEPVLFCRETYVCFPKFGDDERVLPTFPEWFGAAFVPDSFRTVASRHCVQPEINGPLQYVNLDRSEEREQGCRNPGNGSLLDETQNAYAPVVIGQAFRLRRTYSLRTMNRRERDALSPQGKACAQ